MSKSRKDIAFVATQLFIFLLYAWHPWKIELPLYKWAEYFGVFLACIGSLVVFWSIWTLRPSLSVFPKPRAGGELITDGLYAKVRHPIYSGLILAFVGYALIGYSGFRLIMAILLVILFYFKAQYEERRLIQHYAQYAHYKSQSWMFFPGF